MGGKLGARGKASSESLVCSCDTSWVVRLVIRLEITQAYHFVKLPDLLITCEMHAYKVIGSDVENL